MHLTLSSNISEIGASLDAFAAKQLPQALVWSLNETAEEILRGVQSDMDKQFDRPTRFTKNAFMVWRANKRTLTAEVKERPSVSKRHYLKVQERGGRRGATGMDKRMGPLTGSVAVIPGEHAKLDAHGNMSTGERNQIMSQLRIGRDVGYSSNQTDASKKRSARKRATYFVPKAGLAPGVYKRTEPGGLAFRVMKFASVSPSYKPRLNFLKKASERATKDFPRRFARALEKAIATAT